jgi:hypothetical protein
LVPAKHAPTTTYLSDFTDRYLGKYDHLNSRWVGLLNFRFYF